MSLKTPTRILPPVPFTPAHYDALRLPTAEKARMFWDARGLGPPGKPETPLAGLHVARLKWGGSTAAMIEESKAWLTKNGFRHHV